LSFCTARTFIKGNIQHIYTHSFQGKLTFRNKLGFSAIESSSLSRPAGLKSEVNSSENVYSLNQFGLFSAFKLASVKLYIQVS